MTSGLIFALGIGLIVIFFVASQMRTAKVRNTLRRSFGSGDIKASGFDKNGDNVELGGCSIDDAERLFDERVTNAARVGGTDQNADMTGIMFYRSDDAFVGFYARSADQIDVDVAPALTSGRGPGLARMGRDEAERVLRLYFGAPARFISNYDAMTASRTSAAA